MSISHPIGFRGRCQATTSPTAPNDTQTAIWGPAVASGFCRAASDSGIIATANTSVKAARTDADAGDASQERRPAAQADSPPMAASVLTSATLRPDRSGNVTAQSRKPLGWAINAGTPTPRQHHDHNELQLPYQRTHRYVAEMS